MPDPLPNNARGVMGYVSDDGNTYAITTSENHFAALGAEGQVLATGATPVYPVGWKPRTVHGVIVDATGRDRRITVVVAKKEQWATLQALTVPPYGTFEITGRTGERRTIAAPLWDGTATPPNGRVQVLYEDDNSNKYLMTTSRSHAAAVSAPIPVIVGSPKYMPHSLRPRHYNCLADNLAGNDKKIVLTEPQKAAANFVDSGTHTFTVNGVSYHVTGRKDESQSRGATYFVPAT